MRLVLVEICEPAQVALGLLAFSHVSNDHGDHAARGSDDGETVTSTFIRLPSLRRHTASTESTTSPRPRHAFTWASTALLSGATS
jgi:hypothetical protein